MRKLAIYFLAFFLVLSGIVEFVDVSFRYLPLILSALQLVTGVILLLAGKNLKSGRHLGNLCLSILFILNGLTELTSFHFIAQSDVLTILMLITGILLLGGINSGRFSQHLGTIMLSAWLILQALIYQIGLSFTGIYSVIAALAIGAGVLMAMMKQ